jgi:hypothetical protein
MALTKVTSALTDLDGGITIDNITIDGTEIDLSSGDLTIDVAGNIQIDADDNGEVRFLDGGTQYATIKKDGNNALIQSIVADGDLVFQGIDGSSFITAMHIDMSEAGRVGIGTTTPSAKLQVQADGESIRLDGSADTTRTIFFRSTSASNPAQIHSDGALKLRAEDSGTHMEFHTADSERMRIDSSGNVGIGNTPSAVGNYKVLQVRGGSTSNGGLIRLETSDGTSGVARLYAGSTSTVLESNSNTNLVFQTNATERMRIGSDGKVLINTTSTVGTSTALVEFNNLGSGGRILNTKDNGTGSCNAITFNNNNGQVGRITTDGSGTSYVTSSDYRMKENLVYEWEAISKIKNLKPVQFNFKTNPDELTEGFIAHEAQSIVPYAIVGEKDGEEMQGMDYGKLTAVLTKAIQEQQEQIEALQSEINTLKGG